MGGALWLIARRSFAEGRPRLAATLLAALGSIALIAGSRQFALRAHPSGRAVMAAAEGGTLLRPWVSDPRLNPYRLEAGRGDRVLGRVVQHVRALADDGREVVVPVGDQEAGTVAQ